MQDGDIHPIFYFELELNFLQPVILLFHEAPEVCHFSSPALFDPSSVLIYCSPFSFLFFFNNFFWPLHGFIDSLGSRYDTKQDEREGEWHATKDPGPGLKPGVTAAKTKPLYMGRLLYKLSIQCPCSPSLMFLNSTIPSVPFSEWCPLAIHLSYVKMHKYPHSRWEYLSPNSWI